MTYYVLDNDLWIEVEKPGEGQRYRKSDSAGGVLESIWTEAELVDSKITKLAFRQRFTFAEKVEVETAAETNAGIRVMLKDQEAANFIDLSRQDTIDGVNYLTTVMRQDGITPLISTQRASEILTNPIQPVERP